MAGYYGKNYNSSDDDLANSAQAESTPVDNNLYDYTQSQAQDNNNPFSSSDDSYYDETDQEPAQEQAAPEPEQPAAPQNETERTEAAAEQNANVHEAANASSGMREVSQDEMNNIYQQTGVTAAEWARITAPGFNVQGLLADTNPDRQKYRDAINMYVGMAQQPQQAAAPAQAPAQQTAAENPILPSAGGSNYQADSIYDPSKTYGRQPDGSYVYSNSAAQLQRDLNRVMDAGLTVDGYFGEKTQQALNDYLAQYGTPTSTKPSAAEANASTPMSQAGSMSAAQQAATNPNTQQAVAQTTAPNQWVPANTQTNANTNGIINDLLALLGIGNKGTPEWSYGGGENTTSSGRHYEGTGTKAHNPDKAEITPDDIAMQQQLDELQREWNANGGVYGSPRTESPTVGRNYEGVGQKAQNPEKAAQDRYNSYTMESVPQWIPSNNPNQGLADLLPNINFIPEASADEMRQIQLESTPILSMTGNSMSEALENRQPDRTMPRGYATPANESLVGNSYSEALARMQEQMAPDTNIFRQDLTPEEETFSPETMAPDDVQSSGTRSMGGRPAGIERGAETVPNYFEEEQNAEEARQAMESNYGDRVPVDNNTMYLFQYISDMDDLKRQFPNYSDSALMDMMLVNEEMRNGQSSYYKWLSSML